MSDDDDEDEKKPNLKWLNERRRRSRNTKTHENRLAKEFKGRRFASSGSRSQSKWDADHSKAQIVDLFGEESVSFDTFFPVPGAPGKTAAKAKQMTPEADISFPRFHVEHKRTQAQSISLKKDWLHTVEGGARRVRKDPAVIVTFEVQGRAVDEWVAVPKDVFKRLLAELDDGSKEV